MIIFSIRMIEFLDLTKVVSSKRGEGFFITADNKIGAVHPESKIHDNRLFFF